MKLQLLVLPLLAGFLVGCASVGRPIDPDKLSQVIRGKSTFNDVVALLGEPQTVSQVDGPTGKTTEMLYLYSYAEADGKNFIPYYGSFAQEYHTKNQQVTISLNASGVVESISKSFGGISSKTGIAAEQPKAKATVEAAQTQPQPVTQSFSPAPAGTAIPITAPPRPPAQPQTDFSRVQIGMSTAEVIKLMGPPAQKQTGPDGSPLWKWPSRSSSWAWVGFSGERVSATWVSK